jgi:hypothetical protein
MINIEDIITCKSYQPLCDYKYDYPNLDNIPPTGLVHVPLDQIEEFFKRVDSNGHRYVVVSSCSDYGLAIQQEHPPWKDMLKWMDMQVGPSLGYDSLTMDARLDPERCNPRDFFSVKCHSWTRATFPSIPDNIHHWFITNLMFVPDQDYPELCSCNLYKKITAIPFGIAEGKQEQVYEAMKLKRKMEDRENKIYISWNDYTYERYELRKKMVNWQAYGNSDSLTVRGPGDNQDSYEDYLDNLSKHKYVISPPGNGQDCYRTLESIYMGCITYVQDTPANYLTDLPVLKYNNADDIISLYNYNRGIGPELSDGFENSEQTKLTHWKELIHSKRNEMF